MAASKYQTPGDGKSPENENWKLKKLLVEAMLLNNIATKQWGRAAATLEAVAQLRVAYEVSERRAFSTLGADRTAVRYHGLRLRRDLRLGQWHRTHRDGDPVLVAKNTAGIALHYAGPATAECLPRFDGRLRDELLNETLSTSFNYIREADYRHLAIGT